MSHLNYGQIVLYSIETDIRDLKNFSSLVLEKSIKEVLVFRCQARVAPRPRDPVYAVDGERLHNVSPASFKIADGFYAKSIL